MRRYGKTWILAILGLAWISAVGAQEKDLSELSEEQLEQLAFQMAFTMPREEMEQSLAANPQLQKIIELKFVEMIYTHENRKKFMKHVASTVMQSDETGNVAVPHMHVYLDGSIGDYLPSKVAYQMIEDFQSALQSVLENPPVADKTYQNNLQYPQNPNLPIRHTSSLISWPKPQTLFDRTVSIVLYDSRYDGLFSRFMPVLMKDSERQQGFQQYSNLDAGTQMLISKDFFNEGKPTPIIMFFDLEKITHLDCQRFPGAFAARAEKLASQMEPSQFDSLRNCPVVAYPNGQDAEDTYRERLPRQFWQLHLEVVIAHEMYGNVQTYLEQDIAARIRNMNAPGMNVVSRQERILGEVRAFQAGIDYLERIQTDPDRGFEKYGAEYNKINELIEREKGWANSFLQQSN